MEAGSGGGGVPEEQVPAGADTAGEAGAVAGEVEHRRLLLVAVGYAQGGGCSRGGDGTRGKPEPLPRR